MFRPMLRAMYEILGVEGVGERNGAVDVPGLQAESTQGALASSLQLSTAKSVRGGAFTDTNCSLCSP